MDNTIFNLPDGAGFDEITESYKRLKAQYSEERFLEGEAGNEASRRLMELEQAYAEAKFHHDEQKNADKYGTTLGEIDEMIKRERLTEAQNALDAVTERTGEWHYLQSIIFYKRGWYAESKKQLRLACAMEPDNGKFQTANQRMDQFVNAPPPRSSPGGPAGQGYHGQQGQYGQSGGYQPPPPERNVAAENCCWEACCCANCLYCCSGC